MRGSRVEGSMPDRKGHRKGSLEKVASVDLGEAEDRAHVEPAAIGTALWQIFDSEQGRRGLSEEAPKSLGREHAMSFRKGPELLGQELDSKSRGADLDHVAHETEIDGWIVAQEHAGRTTDSEEMLVDRHLGLLLVSTVVGKACPR